MSWRLAELIRRKDKCLDVVVMEETADKPDKIKGLGNISSREVIGTMNFRDSDSAVAVLIRFNTVHSSPMGDVCISQKGRYAYLRYPPEYEATIFSAFDRYFSQDR